MAHVTNFDEEDYNVAPMFGDPFGNRGDYSKGIFYAGRRRFLYPGRKDNHLQPPELFMTKMQKKRWVMGEEPTEVNFKKFDFGQEGAIEKAKSSKKDSSKSKKKKKKGLTYIEKYSSVDPADWEEQIQAGVKIWVNHHTGEVSDECPWDETTNKLHIPGSPGSMVSSPDRWKPEEEENLRGTGAIVYDGSPLTEILDLLDQQPKSPPKRK